MNNKLYIIGILFLFLLVPNVLATTYTHGFNFTTNTTDAGTYGAMINISTTSQILSITKFHDSTATKCQIWNVLGTSLKVNGTQLSNGTFVGNECLFVNPPVIQANNLFMITTNSNGSNRLMFYNNTPQMNNGTFNGVQWYFRVASLGLLWNETLTLAQQGVIEITAFTTLGTDFIFYPPTPSTNTLYQNNTQNWIQGNVSGTGLNNITIYLSRSGTLVNTTFVIGNSTAFNYTNLANGVYTLNATAFNSTNQLWTENRIITIYNALLTITTNPSTSFSVNVGSENYNSTANQVQALVVNGSTYNIELDPLNYATESVNLTINSTLMNYVFTLHQSNSLNISFFNELTQSSISGNFSLSFLGNNNAFSTYINNSNGFLANIPPDTYELTITNPSYSDRTLAITIINRSYSPLNIYMIPINNSVAIGFYIRSLSDDPLEDSTITIFKLFNTSYVSIASGITDSSGFANFYLDEGQSYSIIISSPGYVSKSIFLTPFSANQPYTYKLTSESVFNFEFALNGIEYSYSPIDTNLNSSVTTFTLSSYSINGSILGTSVNCSGTFSQITGSPSGSVVSINRSTPIGSLVRCDYSIDVDSFGSVDWTIYYSHLNISNSSFVSSANKIKNETSSLWLTLLAYIITFMVAIGFYSQFNDPRVSSGVFIVGMIVFTYLEWINGIAGGVSAFIGILMLFMGSR